MGPPPKECKRWLRAQLFGAYPDTATGTPASAASGVGIARSLPAEAGVPAATSGHFGWHHRGAPAFRTFRNYQLTGWPEKINLVCSGGSTFLQRGSPPPPPWRLLPEFFFLRLDAGRSFPQDSPPLERGCSSI